MEEGEDVGYDEEAEGADEDMAAMMGFAGFGTTKVGEWHDVPPALLTDLVQGKEVEGNQTGVAVVKKRRTWRQYMNRCVLMRRDLQRFSPLLQTRWIQQVCLPYINATCRRLRIRPLDKIK
jgi:hypothetical protein